MKIRNIPIITISIVILTAAFLFNISRNLQKEVEIISGLNREIEKKNSFYLYTMGKLLETNLSREPLQIGVKINDYGCDYCNEKILNKLEEYYYSNILSVIVNDGAYELHNYLRNRGYNVQIDSLENYNFKVIDPVIFLILSNNEYIFPYSPDLVLAPELFDLYLESLNNLLVE